MEEPYGAYSRSVAVRGLGSCGREPAKSARGEMRSLIHVQSIAHSTALASVLDAGSSELEHYLSDGKSRSPLSVDRFQPSSVL